MTDPQPTFAPDRAEYLFTITIPITREYHAAELAEQWGGASTFDEAAQNEARWIEGEDGYGDYLASLIGEIGEIDVKWERVDG